MSHAWLRVRVRSTHSGVKYYWDEMYRHHVIWFIALWVSSRLLLKQALEQLLMMKPLWSLGRELMRVFLQCLEWLQPARIDLLDGFGSITAGPTSSVGSRAPEGDFFKFGS